MQQLWKTIWNFLKKLKIEQPYDSVIPVMGIYLKKSEMLIQKNICTLMSIAALFTIAKVWKQPKCLLVDEWMKKLWYIHTMEQYSAVQKKKILPFVIAMDGPAQYCAK